MDNFCHLDVHSAYSFLWGTFTPKALVDAVKARGQKAVALTDIWGLYGAIRFYQAAKDAGIQPVIGSRVCLWDGSWITLIAKTFRGYGNLCKIITAGMGNTKTGKPVVLHNHIRKWSADLICLAGGYGSRPRVLAKNGNEEGAGISLLPFKRIFAGDLFVVLQHHGLPGDMETNQILVQVARRLKVPVIATNQVAFLNPDDYILHKTLIGVQRQHHHREINPLPNNSFWLTPGQDMVSRIPWPEALENTNRVTELCRRFSFPVGKLHPPKFRLKKEEADSTLARAALQELARSRSPVRAEYIRQLDRELGVIKGKGLSDFFLLVREVVEFAKSRSIRHSIRGSAAGSLVAHLLYKCPDPIEHGLLFERFINQGRGDMPDIDIDFDSERRDEVIGRLMDRFPMQTAMVATIQTFRVRSAVRLAARALGYPLYEIDRLTKCLPWSLRGIGLKKAMTRLPELKDSPLRHEQMLLSLAAHIEGLPFQSSVHLGGVILAPHDITDWTPVSTSSKGFSVGQLNKDDVDCLGLLKLDILGLRMHTALRKAEEILRQEGINVDLTKLPLDDYSTYALFQSTESLGIFQLESPGQRHLLGRLQPGKFSDIVAEISLFRPGPVKGDMVQTYLDRRNGRQPIEFLHPDLRPILEETHGVIVFQEQVLRVVHVFAGFSYASADAFRRAMTKDRSSEEMARLKTQFMDRAIRQGHSTELAKEVFRQVATFAAFGFCKAHAVAFAHITYQSAWLKAHHPRAFYLGLLNAGHVGSYPPWVILNEARRQGIPVHPPHVNSSHLEYRAEGNGICVPFWVIRGIGPSLAQRIVSERKENGAFLSWEDFFIRVSLPANARSRLILSGALKGLPDTLRPAQYVAIC
ncbi:MAG: DNA polymerase III subunit alpha [Deltaproteobacteria bacterium]|nr:DNA polymerase III subunit alpha [Deltaproteobacteria bacterium]